MNHLFRALDDPTRRRILDLLGERDRTAGELADAFALGKPTISHHLGLLRRAGLVSARKKGQSIHYRLEATVLDECLSWVMNLIKCSNHKPHSDENTARLAQKRTPATPHPGAALRRRRGLLG